MRALAVVLIHVIMVQAFQLFEFMRILYLQRFLVKRLLPFCLSRFVLSIALRLLFLWGHS